MNIDDYPILKEKISLLKDEPGSYQMKDGDGNIIYVGKAKSLVKRVKQYFTRPQSGKVLRMVLEIRDFDIIKTSSEKEALILEISLIHKYHPKYNVMLMDDKMYPFIALKKEKDPYLKITRNTKEKGYYYFGPFPNAKGARKIIDLLNKIYPLRKCQYLPKKTCLYYHLGECLAPCINKIDEKKYQKITSSILSFLKGDDRDIINQLTLKMKKCSDDLEFEKANEYKLLISDIKSITSSQKIIFNDMVDRDVVAYSIREGYICVIFMLYRKGVLLGKNHYIEEMEDDLDILQNIIVQFYMKNPLPKELIVPDINLKDIVSETLNVRTIYPQRGEKKDVLLMAIKNAQEMLETHFQTAKLEDDVLLLLEELQDKLGMKKTPLDIELYDNSHTTGYEAVSAMVKYINGKKCPQSYRKFKINQENKQDDLASMEEVLTRRITRLKEEKSKLPDLIIVDGGYNQCQVAMNVKMKENVDIFIAGLEKNDKHETDSLINAQTGELIPLEKNTPLFFLLMRMQDEVHRYAITFHRKQREKSKYKTIYDDIKGIGEKRKYRLLQLYPTIESLKNVTENELLQIIPEDCIKQLFKKRDDYFKEISSKRKMMS